LWRSRTRIAGAEALTTRDDGEPMRCACVDIGTNTTRLLVAEAQEGTLREVAALRRFLRLRAQEQGGIDDATVAELAVTVAAHVRLARRQGAQRVRVVATAAIRGAPNREALCAEVARAAGVAVEVLSGEEEARLAFAGATATLDGAPTGMLGVVDVGGGSSELVAGTLTEGVSWVTSFELGSGVLTDRHVRHHPPTPRELDAIRAEIDTAVCDIDPPLVRFALAVGGSATSVRQIAGEELTPATLGRALGLVTAVSAPEAARRFGVDVERVRLLPAGLLLLEAAWAAFGGAPLRIANGGLREGVVLQELAQTRAG